MSDPTTPQQETPPNTNEQTSPPVNVWGSPALPTTAKRRRPVGMGDVVLGLIYSQVFAAIAVVAIMIASLARLQNLSATTINDDIEGILGSGPATVAALLATWSGFLLATWWASTHKGDRDWRGVLSWGFNWRRDIPIAVIFVVAFRALEWVVTIILTNAGINVDELSNAGLVTDFTGVWLAVMVVAAVLGAPIVEELFFRGLFLTTARRRLGTAGGVLLSSIVFGVLHAQTTAAASTYTITATTLIGLGLAVLVVRTGRLGTAITAHILMNASGVGLALALTSG